MANKTLNPIVHPINSTVYGNSTASSTVDLYTGVVFAVFSPLGTFGSVLCLYIVYLSRQQTPSLRIPQPHTVDPFYCNMALLVLVFSLFSCSFNAYTAFVGGANFLTHPRNRWLCEAVAFMFMEGFSGVHLLHASIAVHRFLIIILSEAYPWSKSKYCTAILLVTPWVMPGLAYMFPLMRLGGELGYSPSQRRCGFTRISSRGYYQFGRNFYMWFSVAVILVCYTTIIAKVARARRRIAAARQRSSQLRTLNSEVAVTYTAAKTYAVFALCFFPSNISGMVATNAADLSGLVGASLVHLIEFGKDFVFQT
ncbi:hypothetical protein BV898_08053 [Hypsibius exemplaris]|uniref:G-protein coupled receptors family 1 profile domain-containing protein n=1 Tax=Hypsibius exemplaris TaxID=2072580 RepID=A0A1W0WRV4_HYPEX|nr:hypothetical protein BV898_08053 [Hypsibius exemplaris]